MPRPPAGLGRPAALEHALARPPGRRRAAVLDHDGDALGVALDVHARDAGAPAARRRRRRRCRRGCPATVTRSRGSHGELVGDDLAVDLEVDAALGGLARSCRAAARRAPAPGPRRHHLVGELLGDAQLLGGEVDGLLGRPISMRETTVCSRLAASWFWARSDSVRPRTRSSSPVTACSSVRSRSVTTAPTSSPVPVGGGRAEEQHLLAEHVGLSGCRGALRDRGDQPGRQPELGERLPVDVVGQGEQPQGLVVDELHLRRRRRPAAVPRARRRGRPGSTRTSG